MMQTLTIDFSDAEFAQLQTEARRKHNNVEAWARNTLLSVATAQAEITRLDGMAASMRRKQ